MRGRRRVVNRLMEPLSPVEFWSTIPAIIDALGFPLNGIELRAVILATGLAVVR